MYANSQFERNAPFSVKKTKPFILIYIVATSKGRCHHFGASQTSRYHPHWCIGFSRASQLASQCYELRFFLSLDLPELTGCTSGHKLQPCWAVQIQHYLTAHSWVQHRHPSQQGTLLVLLTSRLGSTASLWHRQKTLLILLRSTGAGHLEWELTQMQRGIHIQSHSDRRKILPGWAWQVSILWERREERKGK